ncbi:MAG: exo-alpha-sialidase [Herpetosiphonaceae bacterium]|nr:exo-alpha-sialidase [Herpetosiphonaceae bacterium]
MHVSSRLGRHVRALPALMLALVLAFSSTMVAFANVALTTLSTDPYTNTTSEHQTEVEPDSFSYGSTLVSVTQVGRFTDGGASNIGWATSTNGGTSWTHGFLPGITIYQGGTYDRVSDPAVSYDPKDNVWLAVSLALAGGTSPHGDAVLVNRSTDGGLTWSNPVPVKPSPNTFLDKTWIVCDTTSTSPFYGHCYAEWDDNAAGNLVHMSTSTDGGLSWSVQRSPADNASGLGGQPVVQPNGTVIVPFSANQSANKAFRSTDGGATWSRSVTISTVQSHSVVILRTPPLPSAEIDGAGKVFVAWEDCRFRSSCSSNDIVYSSSTNGVTWTAPSRVPIDATTSTVDHFIPGLGVDKSSSGSTAHVGLAYYYYPVANCTMATCELNVGFISSTDGGATWSAPTQLTGPIKLAWIANTTQGRMVGDYISTSFSRGKAYPVFSVGKATLGGNFRQSLTTVANGLTIQGGTAAATSTGAGAIPNVAPEHGILPTAN